MRILLAHNSPYYPAYGGGDKSNRLLLEALAARGHECRVVARTASYGPRAHEDYLQELAGRPVRAEVSPDAGVVRFELGGVAVQTVTNHPNPRACFAAQLASFAPDVVLTSTDDPAHLLLDAALRAETARVVYLARATIALPFGPDCAFPSPEKTATLRRVDRVVGVSEYVAAYVRRFSGIDAVHVPISLMEPAPFAALGRFDNEFVTLVNPCAVKGISIFLALAGLMPDVAFAAVPLWGTNARDRAELRRRSNIHVLDPVDPIDGLLARTRVLLVPSLWAEARSRVVVEAMLRGVPVLASNVGGIPEAMMGVDYLLPVRPIERYDKELDEQMVPAAETPPQEIGPWRDALRRLLSDRGHYESLSRLSRARALEYAAALSVRPFEELLERLVRSPRVASSGNAHAPAAGRSILEGLSPERRRLLELRLRRKAAGARPRPNAAWFPSVAMQPGARVRLFCFPHAGAGASVYQSWSEHAPASVSICPVRLPGRESRLAEPPFRRMDALIEALGAAIAPYTAAPFAFFGHSMGAAVAFELARWLRRADQPQPVCLLASGARAPRYRLGHTAPADPTDAEFLEDLERREGIPREVRDNPELMRVLLPALSADAALYRGYVYFEEAPLACPIVAYGGLDDPHIQREHLEAWSAETAAAFTLRMLPGGHFFLHTGQQAFLTTLFEDLGSLVLSVIGTNADAAG